MKKLSKAQQKVMDQAKEKIDYARNNDYLHYLGKAINFPLEKDWDAIPNPHLTNESVRKIVEGYVDSEKYAYMKKWYEKERNGITLIQCNGKTLKKLEEYGLIEIIYDSTNTGYGLDTVKVLNY